MFKTISAALLAVSVLAAPAMAASRTSHAPVIKTAHVKHSVLNANAKMVRHHHKHVRHHQAHKRIVALRDAGKAVLLVSVELDEIFALSDRILVLCAGRITGERRPEATNAQDLGLLMAGVSERAA